MQQVYVYHVVCGHVVVCEVSGGVEEAALIDETSGGGESRGGRVESGDYCGDGSGDGEGVAD